MSLRSEYHTMKGAAEQLFKNATAAAVLKSLTDKTVKAPTYPFKFNKDLGKSLDKFEESKKAKKDADAKKHADAAKKVIAQYKVMVAGKTSELDKIDKRICVGLLAELRDMDNALGK